MNEFLLIMTLVVDGSQAGFGGITSVKLPSYEICQSVGKSWQEEVKAKFNSNWDLKDRGSFYQCHDISKKEKGQ